MWRKKGEARWNVAEPEKIEELTRDPASEVKHFVPAEYVRKARAGTPAPSGQ
jgi:hypothetical protein